MIATEERSLVKRTKAGDQVAFEALERGNRRKVFLYTKGLTKNEHEAEEVYQEGLVKAWKKIKKFRGESRFATWLCTICKNAAFDLHRAKMHKKTLPLELVSEDDRNLHSSLITTKTACDSVMLKEFNLKLEKAILAFPKKYRQILKMYAQYDMSYLNIANNLNLPVGTVMSTLFFARKRLKDLHNEAKNEGIL